MPLLLLFISLPVILFLFFICFMIVLLSAHDKH